MEKSVKLSEKTIEELNKAKSIILKNDPRIKHVSDNYTIFLGLKKFNEVKENE